MRTKLTAPRRNLTRSPPPRCFRFPSADSSVARSNRFPAPYTVSLKDGQPTDTVIAARLHPAPMLPLP